MKPVLYRYKDSESVIRAMDGYTPPDGWVPLFDEAAMKAATHIEYISTFTPDQMQTVFELYATHAIEARICNDIGTKAVTMPTDVQAAHKVEAQLRDFIRGGVSDALTRARAESPNLTPERIQSFVDTVYESAFSILQTLGQAEADS